MDSKRIKCKTPGVRYREHPERKHGIKPDRYFIIRYRLEGKDKEEALGWGSEGMNETKAAERLAEIKRNIREGEGPQSVAEKRAIAKSERQAEQAELERQKLENYSFGELMTEYLAWATTNKRHQNDEYRYRLHLAPHLADTPLRKITPFMLEKVKKSLQDKGLAPATVKHCIVIVRQAFNKGVAWGKWHGENPVRHVKMPRLDNRKERVLSNEEERLFLSTLKEKSRVTWGMAMTALYGGLRYEEITKIRWQQVDLDRNLLHVDGKAGKMRIVPLNETLRAVFEEFRPAALQAAAVVYASDKGGVQKKISHSFWRTIKELGLNDDIADSRYALDFHALRHTWATRLGAAGVPLTVLRDLGGWSDFQMVSRYAKSDRDQAMEAVKALDRKEQKLAKVLDIAAKRG